MIFPKAIELKEIREFRNLTLKALAEQISVSPQSVARAEQGLNIGAKTFALLNVWLRENSWNEAESAWR